MSDRRWLVRPWRVFVRPLRLRRTFLFFFLSLFFSLHPGVAICAMEQRDIMAQFFPYQQGAPRIPGLEPGQVLSRANAQATKEVLPEEILHLLEAGDL